MKRAIILAAGAGSRLRPITEHKPKALVEVNAKPILGHTLDALFISGIKDIIIVCGYRSDALRSFCKKAYPNATLTFIENVDYSTTNNLYSLYLAREYLTEDVFLLNGDLVFDASIIQEMRELPTTCVAVDVGRYLEESMKVVVRNGVIGNISKMIPEREAYGCSIDIYRFVRTDLPALIQELECTVGSGNVSEWTEAALDRLFSSRKILAAVCPLGGARWFEIDNIQDLTEAELLFNSKATTLKEKSIFFIDNDGTLALEGLALPGAGELLETLKSQGKTFYVLTNNSSRLPKNIVDSMAEQGLSIREDNVLISTHAATLFLQEKNYKKIFWVANRAVSEWLEKQGLAFDDVEPEALLLCYDTEITYSKIENLVHFVRGGVPYYATHIDTLCPSLRGFLPDIGLFIELIEKTTGKRPLQTFGKPNTRFISSVMKEHGLPPDKAVIIGDRLYTDISLGIKSGVTSVLTLSGETDRVAYELADIRADIVVPDLKKLTEALA
jgi:HAD superfamily hydrolase (TIGR01450 family)